MNYGFCLLDNSCDYRILSLRAPPGSLLYEVKLQQRQMYPNLTKDSDDHYYIFNIFYPLLDPESPMENSIFSPALFDAVSVLAANNREVETLDISQYGIRIPDAYGNSRNTIAALSQIIIELFTHIIKLKASAQNLPRQPANLKQFNTKVYRDSQIILSETALTIAAWTLVRARLHGASNSWNHIKEPLHAHMSRIPPGKFPNEVTSRIKVRILERSSLLQHCGELFEFTELFNLLPETIQEPCKTCLRDILVRTERAIPVLSGIADASPFAFPLFLCFVNALYYRTTASSSSSEKSSILPPRLEKWAHFLLDKYPPPPDDVAWVLEDEDDESLASSFDDLVEELRSNNPNFFSGVTDYTGSFQGNSGWLSPNWIRWAWMIVEQESVQVPDDPMKLLAADGLGQEAVVLSTVPYLYIPQTPAGELAGQ